MTTPTCPHCGRKFPGDPCSGCGLLSTFTKHDVKLIEVGRKMDEQGIESKRARKKLLHDKPGTKFKRRKTHGRPR